MFLPRSHASTRKAESFAILELFFSSPISKSEGGFGNDMPGFNDQTAAAEQNAYDELRCYTLAHRDPSFIHQHVVDAFTAQNADAQTKPIALTFALIGLYLCVEGNFSGKQVQHVHTSLARHKQAWPVFPLPHERGSTTAADVMAAPEGPVRDRAIHAWCASVWNAYRDNSRPMLIGLLRQRRIL